MTATCEYYWKTESDFDVILLCIYEDYVAEASANLHCRAVMSSNYVLLLGKMIKSRAAKVRVCKQIITERIYLQLRSVGWKHHILCTSLSYCVWYALCNDERARKRQSLNAIISAARRAINSTWPANTARAKCYTVTTNYYQQKERERLSQYMHISVNAPPRRCRRICAHHACCYYCNLLFFSIEARSWSGNALAGRGNLTKVSTIRNTFTNSQHLLKKYFFLPKMYSFHLILICLYLEK